VSEHEDAHECARMHFRWGFGSLLVFAGLGTGLELLHAFKIGPYLDVGNETRRFMFVLGHAHGVGLGLLHVAFASAVKLAALRDGARLVTASIGLRLATVLLPGGFLLGGFGAYESDPGVGVLLVPVGALVLLAALFSTLRALK
jgi:hypothetical protein